MSRIIANDSFYSEFWFTDNEILIFNTYAPIVVFGTAAVTCFLLANIVIVITKSILLAAISFVLAYAVTYIAFRMSALKKLSIISNLPSDEAIKKIPHARVITWNMIETIRVSENVMSICVKDNITRIKVPRSQADNVLKFMYSKVRRDLIDVVPDRTRITKYFVLLALIGGILTVPGVILLVLSSPNAPFVFLMELTALLDSSMIFGLQNPHLLRPIPSLLAYTGLAALNIGAAFWASEAVLNSTFYPIELTTVLFLIGVFLCGGIFGRILRLLLRRKDTISGTMN